MPTVEQPDEPPLLSHTMLELSSQFLYQLEMRTRCGPRRPGECWPWEVVVAAIGHSDSLPRPLSIIADDGSLYLCVCIIFTNVNTSLSQFIMNAARIVKSGRSQYEKSQFPTKIEANCKDRSLLEHDRS